MLGFISTKGSVEKTTESVIFSYDQTLRFNDSRLNNLAMMTWNAGQCEQVFSVLNKAVDPVEYPWTTLLNALLALKTCVYFGHFLLFISSLISSYLL